MLACAHEPRYHQVKVDQDVGTTLLKYDDDESLFVDRSIRPITSHFEQFVAF